MICVVTCLRRDKYNKKIKKYLVEVDDVEDDYGHDEEKECLEHTEEAPPECKCVLPWVQAEAHLNPILVAPYLRPPTGPSSGIWEPRKSSAMTMMKRNPVSLLMRLQPPSRTSREHIRPPMPYCMSLQVESKCWVLGLEWF